MNLTEEIRRNNVIYCKWLSRSRPEAFTELNDSNRELIKVFMEEHPFATGYKFYHGLVELRGNPLYNFCCDYVFDPEEVNPVQVEKMEMELLKRPDVVLDVFNTRNSICLIWS